MCGIDEICKELKLLIESFDNKYTYQFNDKDNRHRVKDDVEKFLYKSGYSYIDIGVEVTTIPDNINEVHITLIPKSDKGIMLLEALKYGSVS